MDEERRTIRFTCPNCGGIIRKVQIRETEVQYLWRCPTCPQTLAIREMSGGMLEQYWYDAREEREKPTLTLIQGGIE